MKNIVFIIILSVWMTGLNAQVTLDKTYDYSCTTTKINSSEYKFYLMDVTLKQCRIYNLDHSLYKTISLSVPYGMFLYDIQFVTEDLFNTDSKIELLYTYYKYVSDGDGYYEYASKIVNEDGTVLTDIPGGLYAYVKPVANDEYKLFAYCYDYSLSPIKVWTNVYSIVGQPNKVAQKNAEFSGVLESAYPNPSNSVTTIAYALPKDVYDAHLVITNMAGKAISTYRVDKNFNELQLQAGTLLPGNYLYHLVTEEGRSEAKKLIIN